MKKPFIAINNEKVEDIKSSVTQIKGDTEQMKLQGITIHKNKNCKTYYTRYRINNKQVYISAKTQKECYNKLKEKLNIIKKEKQPKYYTLQTWYEKWLQLFKIDKVKQSTLKDYTFLIKNIPTNILNKDITKITRLEIQENIYDIKHERQRQKVFTFLKDIFTKANKYKIVKENIFDILEKPKHEKEKGIALTEQEQKIFIKNCKNSTNGNLFLFILYQGLRKGEALAITKNDINLKNNTLTINKSINNNNQIDTTKNKNSNRTIPIFEPTTKILKNYNNLKDNERIFKNYPTNIYLEFKKILKKSNLNNKIRIHDLRHTFITNCKNINIPEHIIQGWVGHQIGSKITSQVYTHINNNINTNNTNLLNKFYSNSTQKKED